MQNIVNRKVKGFKEDFEEDKSILVRDSESTEKISYIWIARELGTHIVNLNKGNDAKDYLHAIYRNWQHFSKYSITFMPGTGWQFKLIRVLP